MCSCNPIHLGAPDDILPFDISNFFHMFTIVPAEQKYMGLIHSKTGEHFCYATCPMATKNSPGASGWFGNAFMWMLVSGCRLFQGMAWRKDFLCRLAGEPFDPDMGTGRVKITATGQPTCRSWIQYP